MYAKESAFIYRKVYPETKVICSNFFSFLCTRIFEQKTWLGLKEKRKVSVH
jgi:hypothetical protein